MISGVIRIGRGECFDPETLQDFLSDSVVALPGEPGHFHGAMAGKYNIQVNAVAHPVGNTAPLVMIRTTNPVLHNQRFLKRRGSGNLLFSRPALQTRIRCADVIRYERLT